MQFTTKQIEEGLYNGFRSKYKAFGGFIDTEYWHRCLAAVKDETLLGHIIFCNDVLKVPPAYVFLRARPIPKKLEEFEKRSIGAFWGYVFKFIFGYEYQKSITIKPEEGQIASVRTASFFSGIKEKIEIVKK